MKWTYLLSTGFTVIFIILLLLFQERIVSARFITKFGIPESGKEPDSKADQDHNLAYLIPTLAFITKIFINLTFMSVYHTSFNEDMIFPFYKRSTATGICNFTARLLTILSPLIAELPRPIPAICLLSVNSVAFISSFFFPSLQEENDFEERYHFKKHKQD